MKRLLSVAALLVLGMAATPPVAAAAGKRVALVFDAGPRSADVEPLLAVLAPEGAIRGGDAMTVGRVTDPARRVGSRGLQSESRHLVVSMDYGTGVSAEEIRRRATTDVRDGSVILFHEWHAAMREELPAILAELRGQGCEFLTFSALGAAFGGVPPVSHAAGSARTES